MAAGARRHRPARRSWRGWLLLGSLGLVLASGLIQVRPTLAQTTPESLIAGAVSDKGPYYQEVSRAVIRFREGNVDAARAHLTAARHQAPKLSPVEVMLATLLLDVGQTAAARAELEKAVHLYAKDPEAYVRLADLDAGDGRVTEAGLLYAKACDLADTFNESPKRRRQVQIRALTGAAAVAESREQWSAARDYLQALARIEARQYRGSATTGQSPLQVGRRVGSPASLGSGQCGRQQVDSRRLDSGGALSSKR